MLGAAAAEEAQVIHAGDELKALADAVYDYFTGKD